MTISKESAINLAREFVQEQYSDRKWVSNVGEPLSAAPCRGGHGLSIAGIEDKYWSVMFRIDATQGVMFAPERVVVLVDGATGRTYWLPLM